MYRNEVLVVHTTYCTALNYWSKRSSHVTTSYRMKETFKTTTTNLIALSMFSINDEGIKSCLKNWWSPPCFKPCCLDIILAKTALRSLTLLDPGFLRYCFLHRWKRKIVLDYYYHFGKFLLIFTLRSPNAYVYE